MKNIFFLLVFLSCSLKGEIPLESKIYVAGHDGLVGRAIVKKLEDKGYEHIIVRTSKELDLRSRKETLAFFEEERPDYVFLVTERVGGMLANPLNEAECIPLDKAACIDSSWMPSPNIIHSAAITDVKKVLILGSTCLYPHDYLITSPLEITNDGYAITKLAPFHLGHKYHQKFDTNYICLMPVNLYGPFDNFDFNTNSQVLPALIRKFIEAKENHLPNVKLWGSEKPLLDFFEFLHVEDLADASLFLMNHYDEPDIINAGCGKDISIFDLAMLIKERVGYEGEILFDASKPDGAPRKVTSIEEIENLGWSPTISLTEGIDSTIDWFLNNRDLW
ncbi:MAG: GDP-L-fucose synthase [Simkaniaceae bacterium]